MEKQNKCFFKKNQIFLDLFFPDKFMFFKDIGEKLYERGIVNENFTSGLIKREKQYPTALPMEPDAIAVPHCDPKFIKVSTVSIVRFQNKLQFFEMGTTNKKLMVKFAFVLTMKASHQLSILQDLIVLFKDETFMQIMRTSESIDQIYEYIQSR